MPSRLITVLGAGLIGTVRNGASGARRILRFTNSVLSVDETWSLDVAPALVAIEIDTTFRASAVTTHCVGLAANLSRQTCATWALLPEDADAAPIEPSDRDVATPVVRRELFSRLAAARFWDSEP